MKYVPDFDVNYSLAAKVAIITGAANGIGQAIAILYAQKGAKVVLVDVSPSVVQVCKDVQALGTDAMAFEADITKKENLSRIVQSTIQTFGKVDILVNCAGVVFLDNAEILSEADWDKTMNINVKAAFLLSQIVAKEMIQQKGGKIINIASQASIIALEQHVAYCASKAAMIGMTQVMALEWAKYNISVNAISPTVVLTSLGEKAWAGEKGEEMKKQIPAGRFAYPNEIAACAVFLASDAANMITGTNLSIDGGYSIK